MMNVRLSISLLLLQTLACLEARGQAPEPPPPPPAAGPSTSAEPLALATTRAAFLRQVMTESQLLTEQYERALAKAEAEVAAAGDYEEARAISQRRQQLRALYAGTASSLSTALPLGQARLMGASQAAGEMLTGWRSSGSGAEWQNFRLVPGSYHLEFEANMSDAPVAGSIYASSKFQPQQSAAFQFGEMTLLGASAENRLNFEIARSPDEATFTPVRVGPLNLARTPLTLSLTCAAGYPANIIRVRNLRLVPVTEEAATSAAAPSNGSTILQQTATTLKTALEAARVATISAYSADLQKLATAKPALKDQVKAETRRLQRLADQKSGPTGIRSIATAAGSLDGFEDISDAFLSDEEPLSGERFKVVAEGQTLNVRLLWVNCAPPEEGADRLKSFSRYFRVTEEDAVAMGTRARDFTSGYLRGKPLRLLVRPDRDKDGTVAALVFLPDVGLYQNVLVDKGLAAIMPPPRDSKRNATEKALIATLQARENAAKNRSPSPGAWGLSAAEAGGQKP